MELKSLVTICLFVVVSSCLLATAMPPPFTRQLSFTQPEEHGNDVLILQNLVNRSPFVHPKINITSYYDIATTNAVKQFQQGNGLSVDGIFGPGSANMLLDTHSCDNYTDNGTPAAALGYKYKIYVPLFRNRSIEVKAFLFDGNNTLLHQWRVRGHGHDDAGPSPAWPSYSSTIGLNMFTSNGNTPTGLLECDLNSPEGSPKFYGPYPINRALNGQKGNAQFLMPPTKALRTGILMHTGEWHQYSGWETSQPMPNSSGCLHAHPDDIKTVWQKLVSIGVEVRDNPGGAQPYPYKPQGLISIEQVGCQFA